MTTKTIAEFEDLVYRSTYFNEFLESDLQAILEPVFETPWQLTNQYYNDVKRLFFMIANMNKSTNFGYYFYEKLHENPFPFCEEVLKSAVLTEKYYNLHDKALKSYVRSYLIKNGAEPRDILNFDKIIPEGHGTHFLTACQSIKTQKISIKKPVKSDFFNILYITINNDNFPMSQKKLACIISYLQLDCMLPAALGKAINILNKHEITTDRVLVLIHLIQSASFLTENDLPDEIADAIRRLTSYKHLSEIVEKFYPFKQIFLDYINKQRSFVFQFQ